jgi:hypothetical protein
MIMNNATNQNMNDKLEYPVKLPDQNLFSPVSLRPVHALFTFVSAGMMKIYKLNMADGRHYIADVGFNHRLYFNKHTVRSGNKYFWRITSTEPFEKVVSIPTAFRLPVSVEVHNFYQAGLNKFDFKYSLTIVIPNIYVVGRLMNLDDEVPLKKIELAVKEAARTVGADRDYKQLCVSAPELTELIKSIVEKNKIVEETGMQIKEISCEFLVGDQDLFNLIKKIYARCEESKSLGLISELEWRRYLESAVPNIALQEETRRQELIMNALVTLGLPISEYELRSKAREFSSKIFG